MEATPKGLNSIQSLGKPSRTALVMASETLSVVADRGYFQSEEFLACHDADITAYVQDGELWSEAV